MKHIIQYRKPKNLTSLFGAFLKQQAMLVEGRIMLDRVMQIASPNKTVSNFSRMIIHSYRSVSYYYRIVPQHKALLTFLPDVRHELFSVLQKDAVDFNEVIT